VSGSPVHLAMKTAHNRNVSRTEGRLPGDWELEISSQKGGKERVGNLLEARIRRKRSSRGLNHTGLGEWSTLWGAMGREESLMLRKDKTQKENRGKDRALVECLRPRGGGATQINTNENVKKKKRQTDLRSIEIAS